MKMMDHKNIVKVLGYGTNGQIQMPHKTHSNLTYIIMEYVNGGALYDLTEKMGGICEEAGRLFMN